MKTGVLRSCVVGLWLLSGSSLCQAQRNSADIDAYFNRVSQVNQLNGNILLADEQQSFVYQRSLGYADIPGKRPNTAAAPFNIASIAKVFTATAVLQLHERGKLSIDDKVVTWLPTFPYDAVTIRHLLTHTSGLADLELFESIVKKYPDTVLTNKNILPELQQWKRGLYFTPGDRFQYCNTEYSLLAMIVEKVSGRSFPAYLQQHVFKPAGMTHTHAYETSRPQQVTMHIAQHPFYEPSFVSVDSVRQYKYTHVNCSGFLGQGNVVSTTADLLLFDQAYFGGRLLKQSTMALAVTPLQLNNGTVFVNKYMDTMHGDGTMMVGLGWEIFEQPGYGRSAGHGGFKFGLATFYFHNLQRRQTIIAFNNAPNSEFGRIIYSGLRLLNQQEALELRNKQSVIALYGKTLVERGIDAAAVQLNLHKSDTSAYYLSEWEMNDLGYDLFYKSAFAGHKEMALEVFKLATMVFPDSFNTYDSYGQLLRDMGKKEDAILMYQKSIVLNPNNEDGKRILKQLTAQQ